jgi:signal transduction histidine kinase
LEEDSSELSAIFNDEIVPAVRRHDVAATRGAHEHASHLVDDMTGIADALGAKLDGRAAEAEADAARASWIVAVAASLIAIVTVIASLAFARRLWRAVTAPLEELEAIAGRVGRGEREARLGEPGTLELEPVAQAFDAMLDALAAKEAGLREADRLAAIGRVAAGIAHEMNNPLGVIRGYIKTMLRESSDGKLAADLRTMDLEAEICERIVQDLLSFAKAPALSIRRVESTDLAREAASRATSGQDGEAAGVRVTVESAFLVVDPVRMRQVLVNLLRNALQASPTEPVELAGVARGEAYEFVVRDRGPGLTPEARERLFEPFFSTRGDGTGLGLAVSFGLVAAHGGTLSATDPDDGGTAFHVILPRAAAAPESDG